MYDVFGDALGRCCTEENFLSSAEKGVLRDYYLVRNPSNYGISLPSSEELPRYRGEIDVFDMILPSGEIDVHVFEPVEGEGVKLDGFVARISGYNMEILLIKYFTQSCTSSTSHPPQL